MYDEVMSLFPRFVLWSLYTEAEAVTFIMRRASFHGRWYLRASVGSCFSIQAVAPTIFAPHFSRLFTSVSLWGAIARTEHDAMFFIR